MENSKELLTKALSIIANTPNIDNHWLIGGGTVLSEIYQHRLSKDIDIFLDDIQLLNGLSPRFNDICDDVLDYDEQEHSISLIYPAGKIDFIVAHQLSDFKPTTDTIMGEKIPHDDPVEIICKKIYYRGYKALPRDIFDVATVFDSERMLDLVSAMSKMPDQVEAFRQAFTKIKFDFSFTPYSQENQDMLLPHGKAMLGKELILCDALLIRLKYDRHESKELVR